MHCPPLEQRFTTLHASSSEFCLFKIILRGAIVGMGGSVGMCDIFKAFLINAEIITFEKA